MKRLVLLVLLAGAVSCAPATVTTSQGKVAYTADQIALQIGHLEQAVIQANQATPKGIPDATAIAIVKFSVAAELTLAQTPSGWAASVSAAWAQAKVDAGPVASPVIASLMGGVDTVLAAYGGN